MAVELYRRAAGGDDSDYLAAYALGWRYDSGKTVAQDDFAAVRWYRLAADQGEARAYNALGEMYGEGRGVPLDEVAAARFYKCAAEQGNADAQYNLGRIYYLGRGLGRDYPLAYKWLLIGVDEGVEDTEGLIEAVSGHLSREELDELIGEARTWQAVRVCSESGN